MALIINATAPAMEVSNSNRGFTPLDVICSAKPAEAILQLQLGRDNLSWRHTRKEGKAAEVIKAIVIITTASSTVLCHCLVGHKLLLFLFSAISSSNGVYSCDSQMAPSRANVMYLLHRHVPYDCICKCLVAGLQDEPVKGQREQMTNYTQGQSASRYT